MQRDKKEEDKSNELVIRLSHWFAVLREKKSKYKEGLPVTSRWLMIPLYIKSGLYLHGHSTVYLSILVNVAKLIK